VEDTWTEEEGERVEREWPCPRTMFQQFYPQSFPLEVTSSQELGGYMYVVCGGGESDWIV